MKAGVTSCFRCRKWNSFGRATPETIDPTENSTQQREHQQQDFVIPDPCCLDTDKNCQCKKRRKDDEHYD